MSDSIKNNSKSSVNSGGAESGQVIVLMALVMVALIGMLGLAIDGGGLYFLWRDAQNASDAAVLTASYAHCTDGNSASIVSAGLAAAAQNGFDNNGTSNTVAIYNPPVTGPQIGHPDYVQVDITATKPSYFIQLVYPSPLQVTTRAIGYCTPRFDPTSVPGLWAGSEDCLLDTVNWTGANSYIEGGMFSNRTIKMGGSNIKVIGPADAVESIEESNGANVDWDDVYPPQPGVDVMEDPLQLDFSLYAPTGAVATNVTLYTALISLPSPDEDLRRSQGSLLWKPGNDRILEGLYYVNGNVDIQPGVDFGPQGVTIVATGTIQSSGGLDTHYYYEIMNPTANGNRYPGIILASNYTEANACGANAISLSGSESKLHGVIYAPLAGINVSGARIQIQGSILGNTIDYSGANGQLIYDPSILPPRPPSIQVAE